MTVSDTLALDATADAWRRRELGLFLRSRRCRLPPGDRPATDGSRRRTKGLRREEMAALLGVSPSWYTKLEQGRDVRPSSRLLGKMSEVLRLSSVEHEQLMRLGMDEPSGDMPQIDAAALDCAGLIIAAMTYSPAFILSPRADYIGCNSAARLLFGNFEEFPWHGNQLLALFLDENVERTLPDWRNSARSQVAMFRTAFARYIRSPDLQQLVETLLGKSVPFRQIWDDCELPANNSRMFEYRTPSGDRLAFRHFTFFADLEQQLRVEVFNPIEGPTQDWMEKLVRSSKVEASA